MFSGPQTEGFIDLSGNNVLKFKMDQSCRNFWIEARAEYLIIWKAALRVMISFTTSNMCKTARCSFKHCTMIWGVLPKQKSKYVG